jgi:primase-polymerase (primpol)-like protein
LKFGKDLGFEPITDDPKRQPGIEFYDETSSRYLTVTGDVWENRSALNSEDASPAIAEVYWRAQKAHDAAKEAEKNAKTAEVAEKAAERTRKVEEKKPKRGTASFDYDDDDALLRHIQETKQGKKFYDLFYQGQGGYASPSEARMALLTTLAFWTRKDETRMDRLFRRSALFDLDPEKWSRPQNGESLGAIEIREACNYCTNVYLKIPIELYTGHKTKPNSLMIFS